MNTPQVNEHGEVVIQSVESLSRDDLCAWIRVRLHGKDLIVPGRPGDTMPHYLLALLYPKLNNRVKEDMQSILMEVLSELAKNTNSQWIGESGHQLILLLDPVLTHSGRRYEAVELLLDIINARRYITDAHPNLHFRALQGLISLWHRSNESFWHQQFELGGHLYASVVLEGLGLIDVSAPFTWLMEVEWSNEIDQAIVNLLPSLLEDYGTAKVVYLIEKVMPNLSSKAALTLTIFCKQEGILLSSANIQKEKDASITSGKITSTEVAPIQKSRSGSTIISAIGNTPLIRLYKYFKDCPVKIYAKMESLNLSGSAKARPSLNIIHHAIETGVIGPNTVVIESSSGNMGVSLAQVCAFYDLRFICVVDPKTASLNIHLLKAYGAEVDMVSEPDPVTGEYQQARINRVRRLLTSIENGFWPNQYANIYNSLAYQQMMHEIDVELNGEINYLFAAVSTGGTLRGCSEYVRAHSMHTKIVAVDAVGSVIFGGQSAKRLIPGHGAAIRPALISPDIVDECIYVSDLDCVVGCRRLVMKEGILAGGSSGGVLTALSLRLPEIPEGSTCVLILADGGERYLDTIYSDSWVLDHFGEVSHLWDDSIELQPDSVEIAPSQ